MSEATPKIIKQGTCEITSESPGLIIIIKTFSIFI